MPRKPPDESQPKKKITTTKKATSATNPEKKTTGKPGSTSTTAQRTVQAKTGNQPHEPHNPKPSMAISEELRKRIAQRAYEIHQSRGGQHGSDWDDWLQAEREILQH
jgi:hypothetical protein